MFQESFSYVYVYDKPFEQSNNLLTLVSIFWYFSILYFWATTHFWLSLVQAHFSFSSSVYQFIILVGVHHFIFLKHHHFSVSILPVLTFAKHKNFYILRTSWTEIFW